MTQSLFMAPVEMGRDFKGCIEVVDGWLSLFLPAVYMTKAAVRVADLELIVFA